MGNKAYKQRHREQGLCVFCSEKAVSGERLCAIHNVTQKKAVHRYYIKNIEKEKNRYAKIKKNREDNFMCKACGFPLNEEDIKIGYKNCTNCRINLHRPMGTPLYQGEV